MKSFVDIFATLGERLRHFGTRAEDRAVIASAIADNPWFTERDIHHAVESICEDMLQRDRLSAWLAHYTPITEPCDVAVIMAGNIPLVGFFDLLCVVASGHRCHVKPSSKDKVLMHHVIDELRKIDNNIAIYDYNPDTEYDMAIATGGDDANRYFREHFATTHTLLRGSRHSVALLDGAESCKELRGLAHDITAYSGLGCRSISMILIPEGWQGELCRASAVNDKLNNIIRTQRAMLTMQQRSYIDCGGYLAIQGNDFPTTLATVTLREYTTMAEARGWIAENSERIQCVATHCAIENSIPLGQSQRPTLWDYADGIDTMLFLRGKHGGKVQN